MPLTLGCWWFLAACGRCERPSPSRRGRRKGWRCQYAPLRRAAGTFLHQRVAVEQLIASYAGEHDFVAAFGGCFGGKPGVDAVDGWLIHGIENEGNVCLKLFAGDAPHVMGKSIMCGQCGGGGDFVLLPGRELVEAYGDALDLSTHFGDQACDGSGIDAAREEYADRDIRYQVGAYRVGDRFSDGLLQFCGGLRRGRLPPVVADIVPDDGRCGLARANAEPASARQGEDVAVDGPGLGHAAPRMVESGDPGAFM